MPSSHVEVASHVLTISDKIAAGQWTADALKFYARKWKLSEPRLQQLTTEARRLIYYSISDRESIKDRLTEYLAELVHGARVDREWATAMKGVMMIAQLCGLADPDPTGGEQATRKYANDEEALAHLERIRSNLLIRIAAQPKVLVTQGQEMKVE